MKKLYMLLAILLLLLSVNPLQAQKTMPEAEFKKLAKTYTLNPDGSQELRIQKELIIYTHTAMNRTYGETFITYDPRWQQVKINDSYTRQKDGTIIKTPSNAFVEVLPQSAADAPAYNALKELVVVHTGLDLGSTIYLDYTITSKPGYLPELDMLCPIKELSPIDEFTCTINVPTTKPFNYRLWNADVKPSYTHKGTMQSITYKLKNVVPRPYSYPYEHNAFGTVQQIASGMMPTITANTYINYGSALKNLRAQFTVGDESVVKEKANELMTAAKGNATGTQELIDKYVSTLAEHACGVILEQSGYRLRPASEVIRTAYGTEPELANLSNALQKAAGLNAGLVVAKLCPSATEKDVTGLSSIVAVADKFATTGKALQQTDALQDYLQVTDLKGTPYLFKKDNKEKLINDTINAADSTYKVQANGYQIISLENNETVSSLYPYAGNTTITENILLPNPVNIRIVTKINIPQRKRWLKLEGKRISNPAGEFSTTYSQEDNALIVTRKLIIRKQLYTPAEYNNFYKLIAAWKDTNNRTVILK